MKIRSFIKAAASVLVAAALLGSTLTGCALSSSDEAQTSSDSHENGGEDAPDSADTEKNDESVETEVTENIEGNGANAEKIKITALSGPTAMGMTKLMSDNESENYGYEFNIVSAVDEVSPLVVKGETDIFCVPANLASVL